MIPTAFLRQVVSGWWVTPLLCDTACVGSCVGGLTLSDTGLSGAVDSESGFIRIGVIRDAMARSSVRSSLASFSSVVDLKHTGITYMACSTLRIIAARNNNDSVMASIGHHS